MLGWILSAVDSLDLSTRYASLAHTLFTQLQDDYGRALCMIRLGALLRKSGEFADATEHLRKSINVLSRWPDRGAVVAALDELGCVYRDRQMWNQAEDTFEKGLHMAQECQDRFGMMRVLQDLCLLYLENVKNREGMPLAAEKLSSRLEEYSELARSFQNPRYLSRAEEMHGDLALQAAPPDYAGAFSRYIRACAAIAVPSETSIQAGLRYDRLLDKVEAKLYGLTTAKDITRLSGLAIRLWTESENAGKHPEVITRCKRVQVFGQHLMEIEALQAQYHLDRNGEVNA